MEEKEKDDNDKLYRLATATSVIAIIFFIIGTSFPLFWIGFTSKEPKPTIVANPVFSTFIIFFSVIFFLLFRSTFRSFFTIYYFYQLIFFLTTLIYFGVFVGGDLDWLIGGHLFYIGFLVLEISAFLWKKEKKQNHIKYIIAT